MRLNKDNGTKQQRENGKGSSEYWSILLFTKDFMTAIAGLCLNTLRGNTLLGMQILQNKARRQ